MPNRRPVDKADVLVIGGGIAGLSAARELSRHGLKVVVIEANDRLGGRIHTVHHGTIPIELGAEFIHGKSKALLETISEAGLKCKSVALQTHLWKNGVLKKANIWDEIGEAISKVSAHRADVSFEEFLRHSRFSEAKRTHVAGFVQGFDAAHLDNISAHSLRRAEYASEQMDGSWQGRIGEGYSALIQFLSKDFESHGGMIALGESARELKWREHLVELVVTQGGRIKIYSAKTAVIALPLGVLKTGKLSFHPALPKKQEAVQQLKMGNVVRVSIVFRDKWWPTTGFLQAFGERFPTVWDDSRGPVLTAWAGGPKADRLKSFSPAKLEKAALEVMAKVFSASPTLIKRYFLGSHFHNWRNDPYIRGAYSYIPVNGMDLPKVLAEPVLDTLFFAGEATVADAQTGTVFGALESGLRAARELLARTNLIIKAATN